MFIRVNPWFILFLRSPEERMNTDEHGVYVNLTSGEGFDRMEDTPAA